jgi:hypothetical protein
LLAEDDEGPIQVEVEDGVIEVPVHVLPVLESLILMDYDAPRARCGEAIQWLRANGMASHATGEKVPVQVTMAGKTLWAAYSPEPAEDLEAP